MPRLMIPILAVRSDRPWVLNMDRCSKGILSWGTVNRTPLSSDIGTSIAMILSYFEAMTQVGQCSAARVNCPDSASARQIAVALTSRIDIRSACQGYSNATSDHGNRVNDNTVIEHVPNIHSTTVQVQVAICPPRLAPTSSPSSPFSSPASSSSFSCAGSFRSAPPPPMFCSPSFSPFSSRSASSYYSPSILLPA